MDKEDTKYLHNFDTKTSSLVVTSWYMISTKRVILMGQMALYTS